MDRIEVHEFAQLMSHRDPYCVSLYMPTHPVGPDAQQDAVMLKNLVDEAETLLVRHGMRTAEARQLVQPLRELPQDPVFWMHRSRGLAAFVAPNRSRILRVDCDFTPQVVVNRRFHVKQLLPLLENLDYFVLDLNRHGPNLFRGDRFRLEKVEVPNMPGRFEEFLDYVPPDGGTQWHSAAAVPLGKKQSAVFHGQGGLRETVKEDVVKYLRQVDAAIEPLLNQHAPLVVAAVESMVPLFRSVCRYPHLLSEWIPGNAEHWNETVLHQKSWPLVAKLLQQRRTAAVERFRQWHGTGKATDNIREVVPAAATGKVDTLLVYPPAQIWGTYDEQQNVVHTDGEARPGDDDLVDLAVHQTLAHAGSVIPMPKDEMPTGSPVAAVFRY
ncbi:MAG: hypothetical protein KatS3mg110_0691 [Pirellulaceae bacterium]|nr:MAG: hypothetical protein KatS3mg110_0691 [Pirellulaceae bacterium]